MAEMNGERRFNGKQKATDAGIPNKGFEDAAGKFGRKNFSGPKSSKSGSGVSPKASGSPWSYGRSDQAEKDYSKDYSRKGSSAGSNVRGPSKPSASIPSDITGPNSGSRKSQMDHN